MQGVVANMKEKVQNATAKAELKMDKAKASAAEKTEKMLAADKVGKEEAHARKHEKEADAYGQKDQKKAENHAEKVQYKQDAHDRAMQNARMPQNGNPYVQAPVATSPTDVPHPHLTHEQIVANEGFSEDQLHQGTNTALPHDHMPEPTNATGIGETHGHHQAHPEAFTQNEPQRRMNYGSAVDQPHQNANSTFVQNPTP